MTDPAPAQKPDRPSCPAMVFLRLSGQRWRQMLFAAAGTRATSAYGRPGHRANRTLRAVSDSPSAITAVALRGKGPRSKSIRCLRRAIVVSTYALRFPDATIDLVVRQDGRRVVEHSRFASSTALSTTTPNDHGRSPPRAKPTAGLDGALKKSGAHPPNRDGRIALRTIVREGKMGGGSGLTGRAPSPA